MKPKFLRTLAEGRAELAKLGIPDSGFKSIADMQRAIDAKKPSFPARPREPNGRDPKPSPGPGPRPKGARESLLEAIEAEKSLGAKADLYEKLSASLLEDIKAEPDMVKKTELTRAYARSEKNRAYSLAAEASLDPKAAKARKLMRLVE